ncbi:MAG TPA: hypothetical protein VK503_07635, partial [Candidatus Bathyarchaeia archaeon]|nr:hypothetical protein [Candidatus Bathyarchaeia archaeon]
MSDQHTPSQAKLDLLVELASRLQELGIHDPTILNRMKLDFCKQHDLDRMPRNSDILNVLPIADKERLIAS